MTVTHRAPEVYFSGEEVEPGLYRDLMTGAVVRVVERDTLPTDIRTVRMVRVFRRVEDADSESRIDTNEHEWDCVVRG